MPFRRPPRQRPLMFSSCSRFPPGFVWFPGIERQVNGHLSHWHGSCTVPIALSSLALPALWRRRGQPNQPHRRTNMFDLDAVVAVYTTHAEAEAAVKELQRAGIDMHTLSLVGMDAHTDERVVGYYNAGDRMKYWGKTGAFWGGVWGM